jgi:putative ABC transport system permease protein
VIWQNIKNALISIKSAKLRSFLTMLGVIIGVFAVIVMVAIGDGVKAQVGGQISSLGANTLTVTSGKIGNNSSTARNGQQQRSGSVVNFGSSFGASTLTEKDVETIKNTPNVVKVATFSIISAAISRGSLSSNTAFVVSTDPNYFSIRDVKLQSGRLLSKEDSTNKAYVAVIGADTKQNIFGDEEAIGKTITMRGKEFVVIGVTKRVDSGLSFGVSSDDIVYIPKSTGAELIGKNEIFRILVQVNDSSNIESVKKFLQESIKQNHSDTEDFSVLTQEDLLSAFNSILDILTTFVVAIAAISLIVGGIGIMNIMLVTVTERTREIGIRKAIGATFGNIMWQFITEAIIISLIGGLLGLALSYLAGFVVQKLAGITPVFSVKTLVAALGISLFIGIVFGTAPAIKAARKHPIQALKSL